MKQAVKEPTCVFNAACARLSISSGIHLCFWLVEMVAWYHRCPPTAPQLSFEKSCRLGWCKNHPPSWMS